MQNDIMFDNIYIGHSIEDANKLREETYDVKIVAEKAQEEKEDEAKPKPETPKSPNDLSFMEDPVTFVREKVDLFLAIAQKDPIEAIKFVPEVAGGIASVVVLILTLLITALTGGSKAPAEKAKATGKKAKAGAEKAAEAVATGAENVKEQATKRATRSQKE
jgi:calnexin